MAIQLLTKLISTGQTETFTFKAKNKGDKIESFMFAISGLNASYADNKNHNILNLAVGNLIPSTVNDLEITLNLNMVMNDDSGHGIDKYSACRVTCIAEINNSSKEAGLFNLGNGQSKSVKSGMSGWNTVLSGFNMAFPNNDDQEICAFSVETSFSNNQDNITATGSSSITSKSQEASGTIAQGFIGLPTVQNGETRLEIAPINIPASSGGGTKIEHKFSGNVVQADFLITGFNLPYQDKETHVGGISCTPISFMSPPIKISGQNVSTYFASSMDNGKDNPALNVSGLWVAVVENK